MVELEREKYEDKKNPAPKQDPKPAPVVKDPIDLNDGIHIK